MPAPGDPSLPLHALISAAPLTPDPAVAASKFDDLLAEAEVAHREVGEAGNSSVMPQLATLAQSPTVKALLLGILGCSPYLAGLLRRDPARLVRILCNPPADHFAGLATADAIIASDPYEAACAAIAK